MQTEIKKGRGKPRGTVQDIDLLDAIQAALTNEPQMACQIREAIRLDGKMPNKDTVKNYLGILIAQGKAQEQKLGTQARQYTYYTRVGK